MNDCVPYAFKLHELQKQYWVSDSWAVVLAKAKLFCNLINHKNSHAKQMPVVRVRELIARGGGKKGHICLSLFILHPVTPSQISTN